MIPPSCVMPWHMVVPNRGSMLDRLLGNKKLVEPNCWSILNKSSTGPTLIDGRKATADMINMICAHHS